MILGGEEQLVEQRLSEPEQVSVVQVFPTRLVLKFRDERDRGESVADQSRTGNTAGTEYLTALQIELLPACVCVCVCDAHTAGCIRVRMSEPCEADFCMKTLKVAVQSRCDRRGDGHIRATRMFFKAQLRSQ